MGDLALNNLKWLIYHKTEPNETNPKLFYYIPPRAHIKSLWSIHEHI